MRMPSVCWLTFIGMLSIADAATAQSYVPPYDEAPRGQPGDRMIQEYLQAHAFKLHGRFLEDVKTVDDWKQRRKRYRREYFHMLGLWPLPEQNPLKATVTGTLEGDGFVVEKLHYQSRPGLYVTGNLYRPERIKEGERLPAVFYVCGHSSRGRNGNKAAYQSHGMWFARHGYVCLVVDTLQLGEIAAIHHGTYRENRWWWHSRGYTSAGVECWNGVRGIDYLVSRPDVDPNRIGVTGISGGGAATFWIAAADERVKVSVPVSGMADLISYVPKRVINGHCDCMFLYNTFQWPWTRIAGMIAPRPMLFVNSDDDAIFPMDANERIIIRLELLYSLYGAGDMVDSQVSVGGHAYRKDIRQAAYRFINMHLKNDARIVTDSEVDLITGPRDARVHPIDPEKLRVFPTDDDIPKDELNTTIDEHFVPMANVKPPKAGQFAAWKKSLTDELRRVSFRTLPKRVEPARDAAYKTDEEAPTDVFLITEPCERLGDGIVVRLNKLSAAKTAKRILLYVKNADSKDVIPDWLAAIRGPSDAIYNCEPRGIAQTRWTLKAPPNYVRRSHVLLGRTVDADRVRDVIAVARYLRAEYKGKTPVVVAGDGAAAVIAAYAALWEADIAGVIANNPPRSHMNPAAPQFLNVLRVCDIHDALGMLAPRPLTVLTDQPNALKKVQSIYEAAGAGKKFNTLRAIKVSSTSEDWPQWRGPRGDGTWNAPKLPEKWPAVGLKRIWRQPIGGGYAGIATTHGRVFTMDRLTQPKEVERVLCFDATSGKPLWTHEYPVEYDDLQHGNGPRSTPTVVDGLVYTAGAFGHLHCLDAATGRVVWRQNLVPSKQKRRPMWGLAASPVVLGNLIIAHVGAEPDGCVIAVHRMTGKEVWRSLPDEAGYATPLLINHAGIQQLVCWTPNKINGLDARTGKQLWSFPFKLTYGTAIASPIFQDNIVFVSGYWEGARAIRLGAKPTDAEVIWSDRKNLRGLMSQPLYRNGYAYLLDKAHGLTCFELKTGKKIWDDDNRMTPKSRNPQATLVWLGDTDRAIVLNSDGDLILVRLTPTGYQEQSRTNIIGPTWAHPAYAGLRVFARNDSEIVCVSLFEAHAADTQE